MSKFNHLSLEEIKVSIDFGEQTREALSQWQVLAKKYDVSRSNINLINKAIKENSI